MAFQETCHSALSHRQRRSEDRRAAWELHEVGLFAGGALQGFAGWASEPGTAMQARGGAIMRATAAPVAGALPPLARPAALPRSASQLECCMFIECMVRQGWM